MPSNDKNITEEQQTKVKASQAITLLLGDSDKLYYYDGEPNYKDYTSLKETSYQADGLRAMLLQRNRTAVNEVNKLKQQKLELKISEDDFRKQLSEIKSGKDTPTVIIKATDAASYKNLIAIGLVCFLRCPLSKVINCLHIIRLKQHMQLLEGDIPAGRNFIYNFYYCCIFGHAFSCSLVCFIY